MNKNNKNIKYNNLLNKIILVFSITMFALAAPIFAAIVYHDIATISIRTNFPEEFFEAATYGDSWYQEEIDYASGETESTDSSKQIYITNDTKYFIESCEWYNYSEKDFNIGGKPKIVVYLTTQDFNRANSYDREDYYRFKQSYNSSTCFISKGNFISATRLSISSLRVVFELNGIKGTYNEPADAYWQNKQGLAYWESPSSYDSGYYDIALYREGILVHRVDTYRGHTYNFASYMRREGNYTFKVRTVPSSSSAGYGKASDYRESDSLYIEAGSLPYDPGYNPGYNPSYDPGYNPSGYTRVGWVKTNNLWYYYRPNGELVTNGWVKWQDNWYYLNSYGAMQTGYITVDGYNYYLGTDGAMVSGWVKSGETFYYYDTTSGDHYGAMCVNTWVYYNNKYFYFDENGVMVTGWKQIADRSGNRYYYYFYPSGSTSGLYGYMATNVTINGFNIGSDGRWIQN